MPLPNIGLPELIIILVIALLILGPGKLPEVGSSLGKSIREFRKAASDVQEAAKVDVSTTPASGTPASTTTSAPAVGTVPPPSTEAGPAAPAANVLSDQAAPNEMATGPKA
jgi:TatA/E family protein of Tat protein translocase